MCEESAGGEAGWGAGCAAMLPRFPIFIRHFRAWIGGTQAHEGGVLVCGRKRNPISSPELRSPSLHAPIKATEELEQKEQMESSVDFFTRGFRGAETEAGGCALNLAGALDVTFDFEFLADGRERSGKELLQVGGLSLEGVVDPLALAASFHQTGAAKVSQVTGDFGLIGFECALEEADANLTFAHQVEEAKAVFVGQGGEEQGVSFH